MKKRNTELIIALVYSVYAVVLMFATSILGWPIWINLVAVAGISVVWVAYLKEVRDYRFRALLYSAVALATFALYNTLENSFEGILTTYCAVVIVLSILSVPEIVVPEYLFSTLLFAYHGLFRDTIPAATTHEKILSAVQILSVFAVVGITHYIIKKHENMNLHMQEIIQELRTAEQNKNDFFANVSNEIQTPVNTICGISERLLQKEIPDSIKADTQSIQAVGNHLRSIADDMAVFSELESERMALAEEPYHLASTIHDIINTTLAEIGSKDLELIVDCDAKIPYTLLGDEPKLRRVILSLVSNAVKFTEAGCISIVFFAREEEYGINLCVKVQDTGIGISKENLEKLFGSFDQVDAIRNRQKGGLGIGLAISKKIIHKMNGFINVKSELGKGSEFQFVVPQKVQEQRPIAAVHNAENLQILLYIDKEKAALTEIRDYYMNCICHMIERLEIRYHLCRNLEEFKRRCGKDSYTHALIGQDEYLEEPAYFDKLSRQMEILMVQDNRSAFVPGKTVRRLPKPFHVLSLAAVLNGDMPACPVEEPEGTPADVPQIQPEEKKTYIDRSKGLQHWRGNAQAYEEILQIYLSDSQETIQKIQKMYQEEDWNNYTIFVHSLKSNSFGIGADGLGEMAKALEAAGKEGDLSYIHAHHAEMLREYEGVFSEINGEITEGRQRT